MKIMFVGSNPSQRTHVIEAFWNNTKSYAILKSWIDKLPMFKDETHHFANAYNLPTPGNRPLTVSEINMGSEQLLCIINIFKPDKIVALGKTAAKALTLLRLEFFEMPHPSGRNRLLNDKEFVNGKIKELAEYLNPTSSEIKST